MSEERQERSEESLRHEYTEVLLNVRHYSNLQFAIFTIFFAVMGGVGYVALLGDSFGTHAALVARIAGLPVVILFWLFEERARMRNDHFQRVAVKLERALGYTQYTSLPSARRFPPRASWVNRIFFLLLVLLWLYVLFALPVKS